MELLPTTEQPPATRLISSRVAANVRAELAARRVTYDAFGTALGWSKAATSRRLNGLVAWDVDALEDAAAFLALDPWVLTAERAA